MVAAVIVGQEAPGTFVGPFDRPAKRARGVQRADIFRIGAAFHAEGAADIAGHNANLLGRNVEQRGDCRAQAEHTLAADMQGEAPGCRIVFGDRRTRLHGIDHDAAVDDVEAGDVGGAREGFGDLFAVAIMKIEWNVVRDIVIDARRVVCGGRIQPHYRRQMIDVDRDGFGGVLGLHRGLRDDAGHRIADEAHLVGGERRARRLEHRRTVTVVERHHAFQGAVAGGREIGAGENCKHAGHGAGGGGIDRPNDAVGMVAANDDGMGLTGQCDVVGIASGAAHQYRILGAQHGLADAELGDREGVRIVLQIHRITSLGWQFRLGIR